MKCAVLSDIHGNHHALKQVLQEIDELQIDQLFLLGDYVGYYYGVESILRQIERYSFRAIGGNHEELLSKAMLDSSFLDSITRKYGSSHRQCINTLNHHDLTYLINLPTTMEIEIDGLKILLCHGAPWDVNAYIYPDAEDSLLARFNDYDYDFIFYGHTHYHTRFNVNGCQIINPGSVGQSRVRGGMAFWGVIDTISQSFEQKETPYNIEPLKEEVLAMDPQLEYNFKVLHRTR